MEGGSKQLLSRCPTTFELAYECIFPPEKNADFADPELIYFWGRFLGREQALCREKHFPQFSFSFPGLLFSPIRFSPGKNALIWALPRASVLGLCHHIFMVFHCGNHCLIRIICGFPGPFCLAPAVMPAPPRTTGEHPHPPRRGSQTLLKRGAGWTQLLPTFSTTLELTPGNFFARPQ